jgi:hypothetical protein
VVAAVGSEAEASPEQYVVLLLHCSGTFTQNIQVRSLAAERFRKHIQRFMIVNDAQVVKARLH